jgi:acyl-CoA thioesterase
MRYQQGFVALAQYPLISPLPERRQHGPKGTALVREDVVETSPGLVIGAAFKHSGVNQPAEAVRQDVAGDPETLHEVVEAADAEEGVAHDEQGPPLAYDLQGLGDRAIHLRERNLAHVVMVRRLHEETQASTLRCMKQLRTPTLTEFDRTTTLEPVAGHPGEFAVDLDPSWSALVGIHGGYMCAIAVRGAESLAPDRSVRTLTTSFLRIGKPGPARLSVTEVRRGRSLSTLSAVLTQDGQVVLVSRLTLLTERTGVEWSSPIAEDIAPLERCERFTPRDHISHFARFDLRLDPENLPEGGGERARLRGHLRPLESRPIDPSWLAMATDCFPPPAFVRLTPPNGGVSIDLTTHIHRPWTVLGEDDWLTGVFEIEESTGGLAVEHGRIALSDGTLLAESFQTRLATQD